MSEKIVQVDRYPIRLGQFLKLAAAVQDGVEAKIEIANGQVRVNDEVEHRRGRQLSFEDQISYKGVQYICR